MKRIRKLKRIYILLLLPMSWLFLTLVKQNSWIAEEIFARRVFKVYSVSVSFITGWIPFSLAEVLLIVLPILAIFFVVRGCIRLIKRKQDTGFVIVKGVINFLCILSIIAMMYTIGCGINYYRYPFSYYAKLEVLPSSSEELYGLCTELATKANDLRSQMKTVDSQGVYMLSMDNSALGRECVKAYGKLALEFPVLSGHYPAPKHVMFSKAMSSMQLTGIFIPFTMEANVNVDIPDYSLASTMCHELAHLHGFIREDEANYIAYLACIASENLELNYSGVLEALIVAGNALYSKDRDLYHKLRIQYSSLVNSDLAANSLYWEKYENTTISKAAEKVNDTYLKANNQSDGIQSYGRMVDLLLAEYRRHQKTYIQ